MRCAIQFEGRTKQVVFVDTPTFPGDGDRDEIVAGQDVELKIREWSKQRQVFDDEGDRNSGISMCIVDIMCLQSAE